MDETKRLLEEKIADRKKRLDEIGVFSTNQAYDPILSGLLSTAENLENNSDEINFEEVNAIIEGISNLKDDSRIARYEELLEQEHELENSNLGFNETFTPEYAAMRDEMTKIEGDIKGQISEIVEKAKDIEQEYFFYRGQYWHPGLSQIMVDDAIERDIYEPKGPEYEQFLGEHGLAPIAYKAPEKEQEYHEYNGQYWHPKLSEEQILDALQNDIYEPKGQEYDQFLRALGLDLITYKAPDKNVVKENVTSEPEIITNTDSNNTYDDVNQNVSESNDEDYAYSISITYDGEKDVFYLTGADGEEITKFPIKGDELATATVADRTYFIRNVLTRNAMKIGDKEGIDAEIKYATGKCRVMADGYDRVESNYDLNAIVFNNCVNLKDNYLKGKNAQEVGEQIVPEVQEQVVSEQITPEVQEQVVSEQIAPEAQEQVVSEQIAPEVEEQKEQESQVQNAPAVINNIAKENNKPKNKAPEGYLKVEGSRKSRYLKTNKVGLAICAGLAGISLIAGSSVVAGLTIGAMTMGAINLGNVAYDLIEASTKAIRTRQLNKIANENGAEYVVDHKTGQCWFQTIPEIEGEEPQIIRTGSEFANEDELTAALDHVFKNDSRGLDFKKVAVEPGKKMKDIKLASLRKVTLDDLEYAYDDCGGIKLAKESKLKFHPIQSIKNVASKVTSTVSSALHAEDIEDDLEDDLEEDYVEEEGFHPIQGAKNAFEKVKNFLNEEIEEPGKETEVQKMNNTDVLDLDGSVIVNAEPISEIEPVIEGLDEELNTNDVVSNEYANLVAKVDSTPDISQQESATTPIADEQGKLTDDEQSKLSDDEQVIQLASEQYAPNIENLGGIKSRGSH